VELDINSQERLIAISEQQQQVTRLSEDPPPEPDGLNKATCWRLRSLVRSNGPRQGFEWTLNKFELFLSSDASGDPLTGEVITSSVGEVTDENGDVTQPNDGAKAFDGDEATGWQAAGMDSGEYIGLKLAEAAEVRSVKIFQKDEQHAVKQTVLEKSINCATWARVAEFPEMSDSYATLATYTFSSVDKIPSGVFQIRSRVDINMCIGVQPADEELEDIADGVPQKSLTPGNAIQVQTCNVDVLPQFWSFDEDGRLVNAANDATNIQLVLNDAEKPEEGGEMKLDTCDDGCPDINSSFKFNEGSGDGFFYHKTEQSFILAPKDGNLANGVPLVMTACQPADGCPDSDDGEPNCPTASIDICADKTFAQWDVPPMFTIETGKKAVNCAPYSHSLTAPIPANSRLFAQKACAAKPSCSVYMWSDESAPEDEHKAWLCERLDIVYSGKTGYELGFRVRGA
jgi:hypothetical protein